MRQHLVDAIAEHLSAWSPQERKTFAEMLARFVETRLGASATRSHDEPNNGG